MNVITKVLSAFATTGALASMAACSEAVRVVTTNPCEIQVDVRFFYLTTTSPDGETTLPSGETAETDVNLLRSGDTLRISLTSVSGEFEFFHEVGEIDEPVSIQIPEEACLSLDP